MADIDKRISGFEMLGDYDTAIIKGVVALLIELSEGKTPQEFGALDIDHRFEGLKRDEHLSPNRHGGIYAIVDVMKAQAARLVATPLTTPAGRVESRYGGAQRRVGLVGAVSSCDCRLALGPLLLVGQVHHLHRQIAELLPVLVDLAVLIRQVVVARIEPRFVFVLDEPALHLQHPANQVLLFTRRSFPHQALGMKHPFAECYLSTMIWFLYARHTLAGLQHMPPQVRCRVVYQCP